MLSAGPIISSARERIELAATRGAFLWHGGLALLVAVPLLTGGHLVLLDLALVRHVRMVWWPSASDPGPVNSAPAQGFLWLLAHLGYAAAPLLVFGLFLFIGLAARFAVLRLVGHESRIAACFAGTLYAINPFTYERLMQGHVFLLAAYGMVPLLLVAASQLVQEPRTRSALVLAGWGTGVAWTSLNLLAMLPVLLIPFFLLKREIYRRSVVRWGALALVVFLAANSWWVVGLFRVQPGELVTSGDLDAYATQPRSNAVPANVAALYGFWRHEFRLPKDGVEYWWLLALPVAGLITYGAVASVRDPRVRPLGVSLMLVVPAAVLLASGTSFSPTRGAFLWLFENVPGFKLFREPQKWVAVLPVCYALLGAIGLDRLIRSSSEPRDRRLLAAVGVATLLIPCAYAWTLLWNWERLRPVRFPADWVAAERTMQDAGGGTLLFLPWHLYMDVSFARHRVLNPAPSYFTGPVISGDNVELPGIFTQSQNPISKTVERMLFDPASRSELEPTLSSLCVRWVVLAKETDYENYGWLYSANGLEKILDGPTVTLWRTPRVSSQRCA